MIYKYKSIVFVQSLCIKFNFFGRVKKTSMISLFFINIESLLSMCYETWMNLLAQSYLT